MKLTKHSLIILLAFIQLNNIAQVNFTLTAAACTGASLQAAATSGTSTVTNYLWTCSPVGAIISSPTASTTNLTWQSAGTYSVSLSYTSNAGSGSVSNTISVTQTPTLNVAQTSSLTCINSNSPFNSKPVIVNLTGANSYAWQPTITTNGGPSATLRPTVSTCYTITGFNGSCSNTITNCITIRQRFSTVIASSSSVICYTPDGGEYSVLNTTSVSTAAVGLPNTFTYKWIAGTIANILTSPFQASVAVAPTSTSNYTLEVTDSLGCVSLPAPITVSVLPCTDIKGIENTISFIAYPNPVKDKLKLESNSEGILIKEIILQNTLGQHIPVEIIWSGKPELDLSLLPSGVYFLNLTTNLDTTTRKIIKE